MKERGLRSDIPHGSNGRTVNDDLSRVIYRWVGAEFAVETGFC